MKNIDSALPRRTDCVFKSHDTCQLRSVADISRGIASNVVCHTLCLAMYGLAEIIQFIEINSKGHPNGQQHCARFRCMQS